MIALIWAKLTSSVLSQPFLTSHLDNTTPPNIGLSPAKDACLQGISLFSCHTDHAWVPLLAKHTIAQHNRHNQHGLRAKAYKHRKALDTPFCVTMSRAINLGEWTNACLQSNRMFSFFLFFSNKYTIGEQGGKFNCYENDDALRVVSLGWRGKWMEQWVFQAITSLDWE